MSFVPVWSINVPFGGPQVNQIELSTETPVYSTYTGNLIGYGPIPKGVISDAPPGHPNHGKPFHVVEYNPANQTFMVHYARSRN